MRWVTRRQNARPLLAMALCTCIAFSAMVPYIPVAAPAEISTERITEPETFDILEDPTERETEGDHSGDRPGMLRPRIN